MRGRYRMCLVLGQESSQLAWNLCELHLIMKLKNLTVFPDTAVCPTAQLCCSLQRGITCAAVMNKLRNPLSENVSQKPLNSIGIYIPAYFEVLQIEVSLHLPTGFL